MSDTPMVIVVTWITDAMKVHAHNYYHHRCYPGTNFPNQQMREVPVGEVSMRATCCGCWEPIKQEGTSDVS
jgi:hypothetical protein